MTGDLHESIFPEKMMPLESGYVWKRLIRAGIFDETEWEWTCEDGDSWKPKSDADEKEQGKRVCCLFNRILESIHAIYTESSSESLPPLDQIRFTTRFTGAPFLSADDDGSDFFFKPDLVFPACDDTLESSCVQKLMFGIYQTVAERGGGIDEAIRQFNYLANHLAADASKTSRRFLTGMVMDRSCLAFRLVLEDCSGRVVSRNHSVDKEPDVLIRVLTGLMLGRVKPEILGQDVGFFKEPLRPTGWTPTCVKVQGVTYRIIKNIFCSHGIKTTVWLVRTKESVFILKDCWVEQNEAMFKESDMLEFTRGIDGVIELVGYDVVQVYDYTRNCEVDETSGRFRPRFYTGQANKKHYRMILTPYGKPLTSFENLNELISGVIDAVTAHEALWVKKKVLHRDISINNVMLYNPSTEAKLVSEWETSPSITRRGILIDLDLALLCDEDYEESNYGRLCMGTGIFIAREMLFSEGETPLHRPWHDLESFFCVLFYILVLYSGPKGQKRTDFTLLDRFPDYYMGESDLDYVRLAKEKDRLFATEDGFKEFVVPSIEKYFEPLVGMMIRLREAIFGASGAADRPRVSHGQVLHILRDTLCDLEKESEGNVSESVWEDRVYNGPLKRKPTDAEVQPKKQRRLPSTAPKLPTRRSARQLNKPRLNYKI